jgi:hypothetical protein
VAKDGGREQVKVKARLNRAAAAANGDKLRQTPAANGGKDGERMRQKAAKWLPPRVAFCRPVSGWVLTQRNRWEMVSNQNYRLSIPESRPKSHSTERWELDGY